MFKKLRNIIKKPNKKALLAIFAVVAVAGSATAWAAWGPDRPVFNWNNPDDRKGSLSGPVFNSFINTPYYGDERNFTTAGAAGQNQWLDTVNAVPGQEVEVRMYVHNNANQETNASGVGVAKNTKVRVEIPDGVANGFDVAGFISADNATPKVVLDTAKVKNDTKAFDLEYVPGSAKAVNAAHPNGVALSDAIVTSGAPIGQNSMNGDFPGCFEFQTVVTIKLKVEAPKLEFSKKVTTPGSTDWKETQEANPGDTVSWLLDYKNTGTGVMNDVTLRDQIPAGLTLVPGSITWIDSNRPNGDPQPDTVLSSGGVNLGNYGVNGGGYIRFRTTVNADVKEKQQCVITNVAYARAQDVPEQPDDARVTIPNCDQQQEPKYTCDLLKVTKIGNLQYRFAVDFTAQNGAVLKSYTYNFGDNTQPLMTDQNPVDHTYAQPGSYAAKVTLTFTVDGQDKVVDSNACATIINTDKPDNCPIPGKQHLPKDSPECVEQPPCDESAGDVCEATELPDTGAGSLLGVFAATSMAGTIAYRVILSRRFL